MRPMTVTGDDDCSICTRDLGHCCTHEPEDCADHAIAEQPMSPQQTYDALMTYKNTGDRTEFDRMCAQLRSGLLEIDWSREGYMAIRAAT